MSKEYPSLRKLLKNLRSVRSSDDFELRLRRRIAEGSAPLQGSREVRRGFRTIPAFAYSLLAVLVVGFIAYYLFLPSPVGKMIAPPSTTPAEDTVTKGTAPATRTPLPEKRAVSADKPRVLRQSTGPRITGTPDQQSSAAPAVPGKYEVTTGEAPRRAAVQKGILSKMAGVQEKLSADSLVILDSLRRDSLRRLEERKNKPEKPAH